MNAIMSVDTERPNNAQLIKDAFSLGYISTEGEVLDATYGYGTFWKECDAPTLVTNDINPLKGTHHYDFRDFPDEWGGRFDTVVFDPPYKLNGTPVADNMDERYGVDIPQNWRDKMRMCEEGIKECIRVLSPNGYLLVKCAAQVCSGKVVWQDQIFTSVATGNGCRLKDRMELLSYRPQPSGRRQLHARRNHSSLLIFVKEVSE